jgi:hypothetical protein
MMRWLRELGKTTPGVLIGGPTIIPPPPPQVLIERFPRRRATRGEPEEINEEDAEKEQPTLKWWGTWQNNPMGETDYFPEQGVGEYVLFQAYSKDDADNRFQNGVRETSSTECPCCGDRWGWALDKDGGTSEPTIDGAPIEEWLKGAYNYRRSVFLHYWDGSIDEILAKRKTNE